MTIYLLITFILLAGPLFGQEFVRMGEQMRYVDPVRKSALVFSPVVDNRPIWLRALRSLRPWVKSAPGTRLGYDEDLDLYHLDGAIGVGIRGKVEF